MGRCQAPQRQRHLQAGTASPLIEYAAPVGPDQPIAHDAVAGGEDEIRPVNADLDGLRQGRVVAQRRAHDCGDGGGGRLRGERTNVPEDGGGWHVDGERIALAGQSQSLHQFRGRVLQQRLRWRAQVVTSRAAQVADSPKGFQRLSEGSFPVARVAQPVLDQESQVSLRDTDRRSQLVEKESNELLDVASRSRLRLEGFQHLSPGALVKLTNIPMLPATILIVDDYPDALDAWQLYLRAEGFTVLTAADGSAALLLATKRRPDLIVLDLELPGKSGAEVARVLRAQASTRDIPLIAFTGHSDSRHLEVARQAGFNAVVTKPCDPATLLGEIRRWLPRTQ